MSNKHYYFLVGNSLTAHVLVEGDIAVTEGKGTAWMPHYVEGEEAAFNTARNLANNYSESVRILEDNSNRHWITVPPGAPEYAGLMAGLMAALSIEAEDRAKEPVVDDEDDDFEDEDFDDDYEFETLRRLPNSEEFEAEHGDLEEGGELEPEPQLIGQGMPGRDGYIIKTLAHLYKNRHTKEKHWDFDPENPYSIDIYGSQSGDIVAENVYEADANYITRFNSFAPEIIAMLQDRERRIEAEKLPNHAGFSDPKRIVRYAPATRAEFRAFALWLESGIEEDISRLISYQNKMVDCAKFIGLMQEVLQDAGVREEWYAALQAAEAAEACGYSYIILEYTKGMA